jgi:hypothetical protein
VFTSFTRYLDSGDFADVELHFSNGKRIRAHRLILAYRFQHTQHSMRGNTRCALAAHTYNSSKYFEDRLTESHALNIQLPSGISEETVDQLVQFLYTGSPNFPAHLSLPLIVLGERLQIPALSAMQLRVGRENVIEIIRQAASLQLPVDHSAVQRCLPVLCRCFTSYPPLHFIPLSYAIALFQRSDLVVSSEWSVYLAICSYIKENRVELSDVAMLFECVRFTFMTVEELEIVGADPLVPKTLLADSLISRLRSHSFTTEAQPLRTTPRALYAIPLELHERFLQPNAQQDPHAPLVSGVLHYIGTHGNKESFTNPALRGRVRVSCSSQAKGNVVDILNEQANEYWSEDVPSSWVAINLGSSRSLIAKAYSLRHGSSSKADALRHWTLQGSTDAKNWTVLRRHQDDNSLNGPFAFAAWNIDASTTAYRYFRVLQTGKNSSNNNFLSLSGIELYGDLFDKSHLTNLDGYISP